MWNLVVCGVVGESVEEQQQAVQRFTILIRQQRDDRLQRRLAPLRRDICRHPDTQTHTQTDGRRLMSTGRRSSFTVLDVTKPPPPSSPDLRQRRLKSATDMRTILYFQGKSPAVVP